MQKCTTYDLVAVITHHGNVGGKINLFIGLRQLCPKWTPLGPELSVGLREMSITSLIESQIKGVKKGKD